MHPWHKNTTLSAIGSLGFFELSFSHRDRGEDKSNFLGSCMQYQPVIYGYPADILHPRHLLEEIWSSPIVFNLRVVWIVYGCGPKSES